MSRQVLTGAHLLVAGAWLDGHALLLDGGRIAAVLADGEACDAPRVVLPAGSRLCPGLVDIQVNGGGGLLFNDAPTPRTARAIAAAHRRLGTTSILPTLITDAPGTMQAAAAAAAAAGEPGSGIIGVHLEGPFLSPERPGVHRPEHIRRPVEADLAWLEAHAAGGAGATLLTLAPEMLGDADIARLAASGIVLSAGHSTASFERMAQARQAGLRGVTHLFNAMPGPAARAPGLAAAALLDGALWCGVIADGVHVHPAMLRLLLACKPAGRIMLVSDAMPPLGTAMAGFDLQGRAIHRVHGRLQTADGTLAGADICLADAVRFMVRELSVSLTQALAMASEVPAAFLGLGGEIGRIAPGCRADLLLLDAELRVLGTWLAGRWQGEDGAVHGIAA